MTKIYDTIIWGASLGGIKQAIELKEKGQKVLLCGRFGFPGGKATESLASLYAADEFTANEFHIDFLTRAEKLKHGVLFRNRQWILMHPEAVKRVCWQLIEQHDLELLFHVTPLSILHDGELMDFELFGREGKIKLTAGNIIDLSDDQKLRYMDGHAVNQNLLINAFFTGGLPFDLPGFNTTRRFETPIGTYVSHSAKNVAYGDVEKIFNRELDRLSKEPWRKHKARILMVPVYPEIQPVESE